MKRALMLLLMLSAAVFAKDAAMQRVPASLFFVANEGQWEEPFAFKANVGNAVYYVTPTGMTMDIREYDRPQRSRDPMDRFESQHEQVPTTVRGHVLRFTFLNANPTPEIIGEDKLSSYSNYFLGRDSCKWRSFVGHYQTVRMKNVWPGIDVVQKIQAEGVETVYRVQVGANAAQINIQVEGLTAPLRVDGEGNLILPTSLGEIKEKAPFAYQIIGHRQLEVPTRFQVLANDKYSLSFEAFDAGQELVIDPLLYGTYLGGYGPEITGDVAFVQDGRIVVVGWTDATDFPVTPGAYETQFFDYIGFVTEFAASRDSIVFSSFLGGQGGATSLSRVIVATYGSILVAGNTGSPHWPTTPGAYDTAWNGGNDVGIARLNSTGSDLENGTYFGGPDFDAFYDLACDSAGQIYFCGGTFGGIPITPDALFPGNQFGGFVAVLDSSLSTLLYSSNTPGHTAEAHCLCLVASEHLWVAGTVGEASLQTTPNALQPTFGGVNDIFISLWDLRRNQLAYCSYLGGNNDDAVTGLTLGSHRRAILCGGTMSPNFPVTSNAYDTLHDSTGDEYHTGFVTILDTTAGIVASTFLGGSEGEYAHFAAKESDRIVVAGETYSADFPVTHGAFDTLLNDNGMPHSGLEDLFLSCLDTSLSHLIYSTFIGGSGNDFGSARLQNRDTVWMFGQTGSSDFPITPNAFQGQNHLFGDGFLLGFALPESLSAVHPRIIGVPESPELSIYPNPFNSSTTISFRLPRASAVKLEVFDILGRLVWCANLGRMHAGVHQQPFNLPRMTTGMYVVRLRASDKQLDRKMMLLR